MLPWLLIQRSSGTSISATADWVVQIGADDCVVRLPADDVVVQMPPDDEVTQT